jgi:hypothetical protein
MKRQMSFFTGNNMTKNELAKTIAKIHLEAVDTIVKIIRILSKDGEDKENEPIKLLEVNPLTFPLGKIYPIGLAADPPEIPCGRVVVEVTPREYEDILSGNLSLPANWVLGEELFNKCSE